MARVAMTDQQFAEKFHGLLRPLASDSQRKEIVSLAWNVEQLADLSPLLSAMTVDTVQE